MPIARREMLVLAKSPRTYHGRLVMGALMLLVGTAFAISYSRTGLASAFPILGMISYALSLMCLFAGANLTADAVAKEKREGTLGLLFLTGLSPWQIVAGKLIANGLAAFFGIFITFPLLSLLMIAGGIHPGAILESFLGILNALFFTSCIGIFISTFSKEQKKATGRATMLVMFFWWGFPILAQFNTNLAGPSWLSETLLLCSVNVAAGTTMMGLSVARDPWLNLLCTHALAWVFLLMASRGIRYQWQDKPDRNRFNLKFWWEGLSLWWERLSLGNSRVRREYRARLLDRNAFMWLALRDRFRFLGVWVFTAILLGVGAFIYFVGGRGIEPLVVFCIIAALVHRSIIAGSGATQLLVEQEQGTIEMLLSSPLSAGEIVQGQFRAAVRLFRGPVALVILLHITTMLMIVPRQGWASPMCVALMVSVALYLFDAYTAIWLSMWGVVISRNAKQAAGAALARLLGIPLCIVAITVIIFAILEMFFRVNVKLSPIVIVGGLCVLMVGNNFFWLRKIHRELPGKLRTFAFRRYEADEEIGFLGRIGSWLGRFYGARISSATRAQGL